MVAWNIHYERWSRQENLDSDLREQLVAIQDDEAELEECFHNYLDFGTAGIRGILGPGINRLNTYMIRKAAEGLAQYIVEQGEEAKVRGVAIAYDNRHKSPEFAMEVAKTLGYHGIQSYVFESLRSTPELSFAVRYLHAFAGVMITASHNPPEYNGLKVYGEDGGQVTSEMGDAIVEKVRHVENELEVKVADEEELKTSGLLKMIGEQVDRAYLDQLKSVVVNQDVIDEMAGDLKIVFTPFHGTGLEPVRNGLWEVGFSQLDVVAEQAVPDPEFSTVKSPNPEEHAAFELAIQHGEKVGADLLIGTDPDADRMGIAVRFPDGEYGVLSGNQIGALLFHYLVTQKKAKGELPHNGVMLKTIVTSELGRDIAVAHGVESFDVLTGFKYISEKIEAYHHSGEYEFLFGYEESYGYLIKDFARDKDAVQACLLAAEVAAFYKKKGMTLYDGLMEIFAQYGYYQEGLESVRLEGIEGAAKIGKILTDFRENPPAEIGGKKVVVLEDYDLGVRTFVEDGRTEKIDLPQSNVLKYLLEDGAWVCARPSGTEPLIKFYFGVKEDSLIESQQVLGQLVNDVMVRVE